MCRVCGREICGECYERIAALWPPPKGPLSDEQKNLLTCMRSGHHQPANFLATSRFTRPELEHVIIEMRRLLVAAGEFVPAQPAPALDLVRASPPVHDTSSGLDLLAAVADLSPRMPVTIMPSSPSGSASPSESSLSTPHTTSPPPQIASPPPESSAKSSAMPLGPAIVASDDGPLAPPSFAAAKPLAVPQARVSPPAVSLTHASPPAASQARASPPIPARVSAPPPPPPPPPPPMTARSFPPGFNVDRIGLPIYDTPHFSEGELTDDVFRHHWAQGRPLVVQHTLEKFELKWSPEYFIAEHGSEPCVLVECQTERVRDAHVADFFRLFARERPSDGLWKLKDWPPSADFAQAFPKLYADFSRAVPVPAYTRRDGALNIASHFPANTVRPDLGPKMYNALASDERAGSMGSTRLHMDIADAVNVMLHASHAPCASAEARAQPPCAAWDLFRAEDADVVRVFLRERFGGRADEDPIHAQKYYLDAELRRALWEQHGVMSHRVYQRPGDVVFIPAGCAHQVRAPLSPPRSDGR
jgi:lysine-specific demethylase 3